MRRAVALLAAVTAAVTASGCGSDANPTTVTVGRRSAPAVGITQAAYPAAEHLKTPLLRHLLRNMDMPSVLVFTRTKQQAKRVAKAVAADGFSVAELHSNRSPSQRTNTTLYPEGGSRFAEPCWPMKAPPAKALPSAPVEKAASRNSSAATMAKQLTASTPPSMSSTTLTPWPPASPRGTASSTT